MTTGTYVYLLWEGVDFGMPSQLHGVYARSEDANIDKAVMQAELDANYRLPTRMWVQAHPVDTRPVA